MAWRTVAHVPARRHLSVIRLRVIRGEVHVPARPLLGISTHTVDVSWAWLKAKDFLWTHRGPALPPANLPCTHILRTESHSGVGCLF